MKSVGGAEVTVVVGFTHIRFENNEGPDSILDGFTVTGCFLSGGIRCVTSSPTIRNSSILRKASILRSFSR